MEVFLMKTVVFNLKIKRLYDIEGGKAKKQTKPIIKN